jgi:hypothetical protein
MHMSLQLTPFEERWREDDSGAMRAVPLREDSALAAIRHAFARHLFLPDTTVVDVVLATYVANHMPGDPVWLLAVGAPSRGKTEVVQSLADMPDVHMLSTLTAQTFASGVRKDRNASLLYRLEDQAKHVLVLKDLTTVLTMNRDARDSVFAALREIYDGQFTKEFGTGESIEWEGKLGVIAGVTPVIDRHHAAIAQLGDRFVSLRLPEVDREAISRQSFGMMGTEKSVRQELRGVVRTFLETVDTSARPITESLKAGIVPIADLVTHARTGVYRDGYSREIDDIPELEAPPRFGKELLGLHLGLQAIGHDESSAMDVVRRVAGDCIPPGRLAVLKYLVDADGEQPTADVATALGAPTKTTHRILEDLAALRLVVRVSRGPGRADLWLMSDEGASKWISAGP